MTMNAVATAVVLLRIRALALLIPPLAHAKFAPSTVPSIAAAAGGDGLGRRSRAAFLLPSSRRRGDRESRRAANDENAAASCCYVPPYGVVPRSSSVVVMNMSPFADGDYSDDRFRKKMASRRIKDPVVQDFGDARDWQASKTGVGRMGDDKVGDDGISEMFGGPPGRMMDRDRVMEGPPPPTMERPPRPPPPMVARDGDEGRMMFEGEGGNYWVNPPGSLDRYPGGRRGGGGRTARPSRRGGRRRRGGNRRRDDDEWWETTRREEEYDDEFEDDFEYGVPPPSRSRSSFRSGSPPPPRPVKDFYDKLFWFGFDPDVTQPTDRTMFGGTRGKFNAMDMLKDREERQRMRMGGGGGGRMLPGSVRGGPSRRRGGESVIQDFGSVGDWNERKTGQGRTGGANVGDDRDRPYFGYESSFENNGPVGGPDPFPGDVPPPPPPPGMPEYDLKPGYDDDFFLDDAIMGQDTRRRRDRGGRRRRRDNRRRDIDRRAAEYERFLSGGGGGEYVSDMPDEDFLPGSMAGGPPPPSSPRRRRGFAYRYDSASILDYDDGEFIDVEPKYATERDLDVAEAEGRAASSSAGGRRRRRSWEDRAIEMDRVPPRGAVAWGPEGMMGEDDPLDRAANEALGRIRGAKRRLERKERAVEEAKEEVVSLKADASLCENQMEDARGGRELEELERELGYILRDVDDASRNLRAARAEVDDAARRLRDLEERNWALLSEYEAGRSFKEEEGVMD